MFRRLRLPERWLKVIPCHRPPSGLSPTSKCMPRLLPGEDMIPEGIAILAWKRSI